MAAISLISILQKILQLLNPPKFGSPVFHVSIETEYHQQPLWKNWKMAAISLILIVWKTLQLLTPQSLGLRFSECWWKWNISVGHYEKLKNVCHFFNIDLTENFPITDHPKVWISSFPTVDRNGISVSAIIKKLKNVCHFFNINLTENFQLLTPQSLGLRFSECQWKWNISSSHYEKKWKMAAISLILIIWKIFQLLKKWQPFFIFFHNGCCWYSISIDTRKTGDPNFGGSIIGNFL